MSEIDKLFSHFLRSVGETTVDFAARRSEFDSESSFSGRSGRHSQYTAGPGAWRTGPGRRSRSTTATCTQRARTQGGQLNEISDLCMVHDLFKGQTAGPRLDT